MKVTNQSNSQAGFHFSLSLALCSLTSTQKHTHGLSPHLHSETRTRPLPSPPLRNTHTASPLTSTQKHTHTFHETPMCIAVADTSSQHLICCPSLLCWHIGNTIDVLADGGGGGNVLGSSGFPSPDEGEFCSLSGGQYAIRSLIQNLPNSDALLRGKAFVQSLLAAAPEQVGVPRDAGVGGGGGGSSSLSAASSSPCSGGGGGGGGRASDEGDTFRPISLVTAVTFRL
jgi:hypothetical protein